MKPKTMILMVVAVGCGLGASYMTSRLLAERNRQPQTEATVPVLVAKVRVPAWQQLKEPEKYFEIKQFPQSVAPRKALSDLAEVKDQRLSKSVNEGSPVTQEDLVDKNQQGIDAQLQPGQRAVAIKVNAESLVGGFVLPGSRVDVICTTRGNDASTSVILQNMLILAVDTQDTRASETKTIIGQTVTLAATLEEAARLALAQSVGELRLTLRGQGDSKRNSHVVARRKDLDKAHAPDSRDNEPEPIKPVPTPAPSVPLPALPPEPVARGEEPKPEPKPEPKRKTHVLKVIQGTTVERHVFPEGVSDEDDLPSTPPTPAKKIEQPKPPTGRPPLPVMPPVPGAPPRR